jgi:hypothetical protein
VSDGRTTDGDGFEDRIERALRGAGDAARPRPGFREELRGRFVDGSLAPAEPAAPAPARGRVLPLPRWLAYPAAAAILAGAFALSGALGPKPVPETPSPYPASVDAAERALRAAEASVARAPQLAGVAWQRHIVEGRPWLLPPDQSFADGRELRGLGKFAATVEERLRRALPEAAAREALPVVTVAAPTREAFEALVAPRLEPETLDEFNIAFALADLRVLLLAPKALDPGGPPCEPMYVLHESAHSWIHARCAPGARLPLWIDEGIAGVAEKKTEYTLDWCRRVLGCAGADGLDPFKPGEVLELADFGSMVRLVAKRAPRPEEPLSLVSVFYAHAESLVLFLSEDGTDAERARRAAFGKWLEGVLDGKTTDAASTAKAFGFESPEALFAARDAWLSK